MSNDSDDLMELDSDHVEEVGECDGDNTASEQESGIIEARKNPFIQYCQDQRDLATKYYHENNVEITEEMSRNITKVSANDWKVHGKFRSRQLSACEKWYTEELLIPVLGENIQLDEESRAEQWEKEQKRDRVVKNLFVDTDKAELVVKIGNSRTQAKCTVDVDHNSPTSEIIVIGQPAEVNLAVNLMVDEETRLIIAIAAIGFAAS